MYDASFQILPIQAIFPAEAVFVAPASRRQFCAVPRLKKLRRDTGPAVHRPPSFFVECLITGNRVNFKSWDRLSFVM